MSQRTRPILLAATAAALALPGGAGAAVSPAQVARGEQINRASGSAGAFTLLTGGLRMAMGPVSNDGRFATYSVQQDTYDPKPDFAFANPGDGLWIRDLVANRTTKIGTSNAFFTALDRSEHLYSIVTKQSFDAADTNGAPDLYAYERLTGLKVLLSRAGGHRGAALGLTGVGSLTRDGRSAIFTTASGVYRRNVLTGQNTRISGGTFVNGFEYYGEPDFRLASNSYGDDHASADGRVVATSEAIIAPGRTTPAPKNDYDEALEVLVSEDGSTALYSRDGVAISGLRLFDPATGAETPVTVPAALQNRLAVPLRLSADGRSGLFFTLGYGPGVYIQELVRWTFATGAHTVVDLPQGPISRNERFATTGIAASFGPLVVIPAPGARVPGTIDPPSPNSYVTFEDACVDGVRATTVIGEPRSPLPAPSTFRFRLRNAAGAVTFDRTTTVPTPEEEYERVELPVGTGALRLEVTVTLADGRVITERTERPAC